MEMLEQDAAVDREIIDPLLGLPLAHIEKMPRPHLLDLAAEFLEHLINGHGADRDWRGVDDRLADAVDVAAGREVHHRVGPEMDGRMQLFQLFVDVARDGRVADVGVDLGERGDPDGHRLELFLQMDFVGGDHHPPAADFRANQLRRQVFAASDEFHLRRQQAGTSRFELCHRKTYGG